MATHKPALYLLQANSILPEEGCLKQHLQFQVKRYLALAGLSRQFFDGQILELSLYSEPTWQHMGSVHPLHDFFQCSNLRDVLFTAFRGETLLVLITLPVTVRAPFLDSSSPTLPLPYWSLCQEQSVGDWTIMQALAPDHLSLALTLGDRVVLEYHISAVEGRFPPSRSLLLFSKEL